MDIIVDLYQKNFLQRFDRDDAIPYYSAFDFPGLLSEKGTFQNSAGVPVCYYFFHYERFDPEKLILFCPGIGPGHIAYFAEIEMLCRSGYRVLTLDYTGCGGSGGERLPSLVGADRASSPGGGGHSGRPFARRLHSAQSCSSYPRNQAGSHYLGLYRR